MSRPRRFATLLVLFVTLVPVLAACRGGERSPVEILTSAGDRTVRAGSARMALRLTMSGAGPELEITGDGVTDFDAKASQVTLDMAPLFAAFGIDSGNGTVEARTFGTRIYIRAPALTDLLRLPTPWILMDTERIADEQAGADLGQLGSFANNDPRQTLAILEGSTRGSIDELGDEEIRGVDTTHYRARVDLRRAYERSGAIVDRNRFEQFLDQLGTETLDVDAWIDDDGLPRRIAYETPFPGQEAGARLVMDLFEFGTDADLSPPADKDVTDLLELVGQ